MEDNITNDIIELYRKGDWRSIVERYHDHPERSKLLWVFPSEENFVFLRNCVEELQCDGEGIVSVGCGSGLLEWMICEATGIPVKGIEVDGAWWRCKYAPPSFIPLLFTPPTLDKETMQLLRHCQRTALMFCYFNNRPAFEDYLKHFSGNVLIVIGPGYGKGVHTDPRPFGDIGDDWTLTNSQEVRTSGDFIAIYCRNKTVMR